MRIELCFVVGDLMRISFRNWDVYLSESSFPEEVMVELTTHCNLSCIHCFRNTMKEDFGWMSDDIIRSTLKYIVENNVKRVSLSGWGEPLLHPKALWFIEKLKEKDIFVILNTNGVLLSRFADRIVELCVDEVIVSVDSVRKSTYESIRRGSNIDNILSGLEHVRNLKKEFGSTKPLLSIQFTVNILNYHDIPYLIDFANKFGIGKIVLSNIIPVSRNHEELACYNDEECISRSEEYIRELGRRLAFIWNIQFVKSYFRPQQAFSCPFIDRNALFIRWDGGIAPCINYAHSWRFYYDGVPRDINSVIFGHIRDGLLNVWRRREYVEFRFRAEFGYRPSCFDCELKDYCYYTLSNDSDCYGNSPTCAHCPYARGLSICPL